jgi:hypothetical protein
VRRAGSVPAELEDDHETFDVSFVRAENLFSGDELALLDALAGEHELRREDITALIDKERSVQGMGRRHGINMFIRSHIGEVADRRLRERRDSE